jgi:nucleoside-diphosphate-sugar epimerase
MGEHILRTVAASADLEWAVGRLFFIYGPQQHVEGGYKSVIVTNFERLLRGLAPTIRGDGQQALDYVYVDDAVDALWRLATASESGAIVNVASGRAWTIVELTRAMQLVSGTSTAAEFLPPDWTAGTTRSGDPSYAAELLGWRASTPMDRGLARTWADLHT